MSHRRCMVPAPTPPPSGGPEPANCLSAAPTAPGRAVRQVLVGPNPPRSRDRFRLQSEQPWAHKPARLFRRAWGDVLQALLAR